MEVTKLSRAPAPPSLSITPFSAYSIVSVYALPQSPNPFVISDTNLLLTSPSSLALFFASFWFASMRFWPTFCLVLYAPDIFFWISSSTLVIPPMSFTFAWRYICSFLSRLFQLLPLPKMALVKLWRLFEALPRFSKLDPTSASILAKPFSSFKADSRLVAFASNVSSALVIGPDLSRNACSSEVSVSPSALRSIIPCL